MKKEELIRNLSASEKLIRAEYGLNQEQMAGMLGMSRKSLVETEKGRRTLSWTECIALCALFADSRLFADSADMHILEQIRNIAYSDTEISYPSTMGGKVWWRDIEETGGYRIQQNVISSHYRILNPKDERIASSFDMDEIREIFRNMTREK